MKKLNPICSNTAGTHKGNITRYSAAQIDSRYLLCRCDGSTKVAVCNKNEAPIGIITDLANAADPVNVALLGNTGWTSKLWTTTALNAGDTVCVVDGGKIGALPTAKGSYWKVGVALTEAKINTLVEVSTCFPQAVQVA